MNVAAGPRELARGQLVAGRYRVERLLAVGGMGSIYLVHHVRTDEALALKLLHPAVLCDASAVERFLREARAPAQFSSDHVARVTDADTAPELDDAPFYVMELLQGRDLERIVAEDGPLSIEDALLYLKQTALALDRAHEAAIVHRDLKPENVFVVDRDDGTRIVKLLDFGIARFNDMENVPQRPLATQAGYVMGTPAYMAPEQAVGDLDAIGPATDIWSLGLLTFKLLVGKGFWAFEGPTDLYAKILAEPIPSASECGSSLGPSFDAWLARCLERDPRERFSSAGQAITSLTLALSGSPPGVASSSRLPRWCARFAIPLGLAVVAVLCFVGFEIARVGSSAQEASSPKAAGLVTMTAAPASGFVALTAESAMPQLVSSDDAASPQPPKAPPRWQEPAREARPTREQRRRLETLQRLCEQGTFTPAECTAKRISILSPGP